MLPSIGILLRAVISTYFLDKYCTVLLANEDILTSNYSRPIVSIDPNYEETYSAAVRQSLDFGCEAYVLVHNKPFEFLEIFDYHVQITNQRRGNRQFIFVFEDEIQGKRGQDLAMEFLMSSILKNMPDILVVFVADNSSTHEFFTDNTTDNTNIFEAIDKSVLYKLVTRSIDNPTSILLDYWSCETNDFIHHADLFPDKIWNMNGVTLNVTILYYPPYDIVFEDVKVRPFEEPSTTFEGIDVLVLREFANRHNCTLDVKVENNLWGEVYPNRTGFGLFGSMAESKFDIGIGGVGSWSTIKPYMDLCYPYVRTSITCLVPVPRLLDKFSMPILPFTYSLWLAVSTSTLVVIIAFYYISQKTNSINNSVIKPESAIRSVQEKIIRALDGLYEASYIIYGMMLLQPLPSSAEYSNLAFRSLLVFVLLQTLLLSTAYSSGLAAIMTVPKYEKPIETVQDLVDSGLEWGANDDVWIYSISGSTQPRIRKLIEHFRAYDDKKLEEIALLRKYAYTIERMAGGNFAIGDYITRKNVVGLQAMKEKLYWEQCTSLFRKSSPFLPHFEAMVFRLLDGGFIDAMETQVTLKFMDFFVQLRVSLSVRSGDHGDSDDGPVILRVSDLLGVFCFWSVGLILSSVCFLLEIWTLKKYQFHLK